MPAEASGLTAEDVVRGWPCGRVPAPARRRPGAPRPSPPPSPRAAVEDVLAAALARPPCLVAFSGGRDSALLLAAAVGVARRRRLPLPIAVTERWDGVGGTEESDWQERVVRHLRPMDWQRLDATGRTDLLGADVTGSLLRHGLLWPALAHTRAWYLPELLGSPGGDGRDPRGTLVDGEGGDEVLGGRRLAPVLSLTGWRADRRTGPDRRLLAAALRGVAPKVVRRTLVRRSLDRRTLAPWLRPPARRAFARALADDAGQEPLSWRAAVLAHPQRRSVLVGMAALDRVIAGAGVRPVHPLLHPVVVDAVAAAGGRVGFASRTAALLACFGDLLPADVSRRTAKATFTSAVFGPSARRFADAWDGGGLPGDLIDPEALVSEWHGAEPSALSFTALHAAWLCARNSVSRPAAPAASPGRR